MQCMIHITCLEKIAIYQINNCTRRAFRTWYNILQELADICIISVCINIRIHRSFNKWYHICQKLQISVQYLSADYISAHLWMWTKNSEIITVISSQPNSRSTTDCQLLTTSWNWAERTTKSKQRRAFRNAPTPNKTDYFAAKRTQLSRAQVLTLVRTLSLRLQWV